MAGPARIVARRSAPGALGGLVLAGRLEGSRGASTTRSVRFPSYGCTFLFGGAGRYRDADHDVALGPGSLVLVFPGRPHWYGATGERGWDEVFLVFGGPAFDLAQRVGLLDPGRPVHQLAPVADWLGRFDRFRVRPAPRAAHARDGEVCDVLKLLVEATSVDASDVPSAGTGWYEASCRRLEADLDRAVALADIAAAVGLPYETWRRSFRRRSGYAPAHYRLQRRLEAARSLFSDTSLSTAEVAVALGFSDERHLIRHFRTLTGLTPRQFRDRRR